MAIAMLLTTALFILLASFQHITQQINESNQVSLYLKSTIKEVEIKNWIYHLKKDPFISNATYISPQEGLRELARQFENDKTITNLEENPLPPVILLKLHIDTKENMEKLVLRLKNNPTVTMVHLESEWTERLLALIKLGNRVAMLLSLLFSLGVLFIVAHTIEAATHRNQQEINLLQLIGAPISYIRRPFLYIGALLGIGASFVSMLLIFILFIFIQNPLNQFLHSYHLQNAPSILGLWVFVPILFCSLSLGWLGAWIAFYKYNKSL
jgi:cell division transport system permease protein